MWFRSFGLAVPLPDGGISTEWLALLESDITTFVNNFILRKLTTTLAAFIVLQPIRF
jgi:hypothetical protein